MLLMLLLRCALNWPAVGKSNMAVAETSLMGATRATLNYALE